MAAASGRPQAGRCKPGPPVTKRIVSLRLRKRWGPVRLAAETGVAPSTAGAVLGRCRISRQGRLRRRERPPLRDGDPAPGELPHADVEKLGNIRSEEHNAELQ